MAPARILAVGVHDPGLWGPAGAARAGYVGLCDPARLAETTGMNVVDAFPARDVAAGGQGGPITAIAEWVLFGHPRQNRVLLDLGRTTRLSYLAARQPNHAGGLRVLSFDVGPGMRLIDLLAQRFSNGEHALRSRRAARGPGAAAGGPFGPLAEPTRTSAARSRGGTRAASGPIGSFWTPCKWPWRPAGRSATCSARRPISWPSRLLGRPPPVARRRERRPDRLDRRRAAERDAAARAGRAIARGPHGPGDGTRHRRRGIGTGVCRNSGAPARRPGARQSSRSNGNGGCEGLGPPDARLAAELAASDLVAQRQPARRPPLAKRNLTRTL